MLPSFDALVACAFDLARDDSWTDLLAENIYWASMEGFLQASLLGALNRTSSEFMTDRERSMGRGTITPDLLVMPKTSEVHDAWWAGREYGGKAARSSFRSHTALFVQLKVAWTPGNAKASAVLARKCVGIARDVAGLREHLPGAPAAVGVLVSGFHQRAEGAAAVTNSLEQVRACIQRDVAEEVSIPMLDAARPSRWAFLEPDRTAFSTLWLAQLTSERGIS